MAPASPTYLKEPVALLLACGVADDEALWLSPNLGPDAPVWPAPGRRAASLPLASLLELAPPLRGWSYQSVKELHAGTRVAADSLDVTEPSSEEDLLARCDAYWPTRPRTSSTRTQTHEKDIREAFESAAYGAVTLGLWSYQPPDQHIAGLETVPGGSADRRGLPPEWPVEWMPVRAGDGSKPVPACLDPHTLVLRQDPSRAGLKPLDKLRILVVWNTPPSSKSVTPGAHPVDQPSVTNAAWRNNLRQRLLEILAGSPVERIEVLLEPAWTEVKHHLSDAERGYNVVVVAGHVHAELADGESGSTPSESPIDGIGWQVFAGEYDAARSARRQPDVCIPAAEFAEAIRTGGHVQVCLVFGCSTWTRVCQHLQSGSTNVPFVLGTLHTIHLDRAWQRGISEFLEKLGTTRRVDLATLAMRNVLNGAVRTKPIGSALASRLHGTSFDVLANNGSDTLLPSSVARIKDTESDKSSAVGRRACIEALVDRPWTPGHKTDLPFHFTLASSDDDLRGRLATRELPEQVDAFLASKEPALWWLWTGLEGAGKSRLAMSACRRAEEAGWAAGFLDIKKWNLGKTHLAITDIRRDTLIVLDDVGLDAPIIRSMLDELSLVMGSQGKSALRSRLRLLLLERHSEPMVPRSDADLMPQWFIDLFERSGSSHSWPEFLNWQFPRLGASSTHIANLLTNDARELATEYLRQEGCTSEPGAMADRVVELLSPPGRPSQLRPLHVKITASVLLQPGVSDVASFEEVIRRYLEHRIRYRRKQLKSLYGDTNEADLVLNLICVATLVRSLRLSDVPVHEDLPRIPLRRGTEILALLGQSSTDSVVRGVEPDLIGEWFVKLWCDNESSLGGTLSVEALSEILEALPRSNIEIADFVQRTYRYFRDFDLWKVLRNRLGRYSTPFGRLFDSTSKQVALLGGTTDQAEKWYHESVEDAIARAIDRNHGIAVVVDLMAGGSERPKRLLEKFESKLMFVAVDRDDSRLTTLSVSYPNALKVIKHRIRGRLGLAGELKRAYGSGQCDVLIAKKALHEIDWKAQRELIAEIGEVVKSPSGEVVLYADSPKYMDSGGHEKLENVIGPRLPRTVFDVQPHALADLEQRVAGLARVPFAGNVRSDAAVFANMWIRLKDWANYNAEEYENRYFSSKNELMAQFGLAGFDTDESVSEVASFWMELQPTRFVEEAINRLGYLCADPTTRMDDLAGVFDSNRRYGVFREVVGALLWNDQCPTLFGASAEVNARFAEHFDLEEFLGDMIGLSKGSQLRKIDFPRLESPSFRMPVHVFCFKRSTPG